MREITEKSYADALEKVIGLVEKRKFDLNVRHLVIVPDNYTFTLEKRFFSKALRRPAWIKPFLRRKILNTVC